MIYVRNDLPRPDAALGLVRAEQLTVAEAPPGFEQRLDALLDRRCHGLDEAEDAIRRAARDLLRNGAYKPTGRGKPASEYLARAALRPDYTFPRINGPVDVANYLSLKTLLPISIWDLDRAGTDRFVFRLGRPGEAYVFNAGGQEIKLEDLIVGCRLTEASGPDGEPIVNAVKDCLATKTTEATRRVAACVYAPLGAVTQEGVRAMCAEFADLLGGCGDGVATAHGLVLPGEHARI